MTLKEYLDNSPRGTAASLAKKLNISPSYLSQLASGDAPISTERAVEIEVHTNMQVTREEMFPDTYLAKWPELADRSNKPKRRMEDINPPKRKRRITN